MCRKPVEPTHRGDVTATDATTTTTAATAAQSASRPRFAAASTRRWRQQLSRRFSFRLSFAAVYAGAPSSFPRPVIRFPRAPLGHRRHAESDVFSRTYRNPIRSKIALQNFCRIFTRTWFTVKICVGSFISGSRTRSQPIMKLNYFLPYGYRSVRPEFVVEESRSRRTGSGE